MENHHFNRYCNNLPEGRGYNGIFCGIFSRNKQSHGVFMGADDIRAISWESFRFLLCTSKCTAVFRKTIPPQTGIQSKGIRLWHVWKAEDSWGSFWWTTSFIAWWAMKRGNCPRSWAMKKLQKGTISWLVVLTILNNMSSSMGRMTSHILKIRENKTCLKPQTSFPFSSAKMGSRDSPHSEVPSHWCCSADMIKTYEGVAIRNAS